MVVNAMEKNKAGKDKYACSRVPGRPTKKVTFE